jgi:hypothetical protein
LMMPAVENTKMNDCYFEKKDWRQCRDFYRPVTCARKITIGMGN